MAPTELKAIEAELATQSRARKDVIEEFQTTVMRKAVDQAKEAASVDELREWAEASGSVLECLRRSPMEVVRVVLETVQDVEHEDDEQDEQALEDWGRLQVLHTYDEVRKDSYTVGWLEGNGRSRQQLNQWRKAQALFGIPGVPGVKGYIYPRWQFTATLRPKEWLPSVLEAAEDARLDPLSLHLFMTNDEAGSDGSPLEAAEAGDLDTAVKLVAAANAQGR
jgi:hypothetical protein